MGMRPVSPAIWTTCVKAPFGLVKFEASDAALRRVVLGDFSADSCEVVRQDAPAWFLKLFEQMNRYFNGEEVDFGWVPVDFDAGIGAFRARVLEAARSIPYGQTVSYGELASAVGCAAAARAVGGAMAANPVPIIIPCHRVLPKSGGVGGFSAGRDIKLCLLRLEGVGL